MAKCFSLAQRYLAKKKRSRINMSVVTWPYFFYKDYAIALFEEETLERWEIEACGY
jgi:hypothetical protein